MRRLYRSVARPRRERAPHLPESSERPAADEEHARGATPVLEQAQGTQERFAPRTSQRPLDAHRIRFERGHDFHAAPQAAQPDAGCPEALLGGEEEQDPQGEDIPSSPACGERSRAEPTQEEEDDEEEKE